jgi:serine/threonine protein kinase
VQDQPPHCDFDWSAVGTTIVSSVQLHLDGTRVTERVIGQGSTGLVIEQGPYAVKLPILTRDVEVDGVPVEMLPLTPKEGDFDERPALIEAMETEKAIYRRLGVHVGIVRCHNLESPEVSIRMDLMKNRDLRRHLLDGRPESPPDQKTKLSWLRQMAHTMAYIHERRIIIADVRLDNFLLDEDGSHVKICDFGGSTMMPLDWDLEGTDDIGYSVGTDIGEFGTAMYEVVTGVWKCDYELFQEREGGGLVTACPPRDRLPPTDDVWLGHIIDKCWRQAYRSAKELAEELDREKGSLSGEVRAGEVEERDSSAWEARGSA